jgi:TPR repeat protein
VHELINACLSKDPPPIESILLQLQEMASFDVADGQSSQTSLNSISTQNGKEYSSGQSLMIHLFNSLNPVNPYDFIAEFNKRFSQNRTLDSLALEREINLLPVIDAESLNRLIFSDIDKCNDSSALCKDDIEAIDLFLDKFDASSSIKQVCLGRKYLELKNEEYAFKWFQMAANSGDPIGQYNLSHCYMHGLGVTKSDAKSLEWLILSAKSGEATALNDLGMKYYYGHDVAKDHQLALQYVCRAALASNPAACYNLGYFYENGADSVPIDINEAIIWYTQAHKCHFPLAAFKLGMLMKEGVHIPRDDKGALKMFKIAAASKNLDASFQVYEYYLNAKVTGHDESRALKWLSRTADAGHMESQYRLGRAFRYGLLGCQISPLKAIEYFKMAAAKGHWLSCYEIGLCYSSGVGIGKNSSKAKKYFGQAIKSADPNSKYEYAMCLMKEYNEADGCDGFMKLFLEAGQAGTVEACVQLATIYEQGLFEIPSDDEKKIYWLQKASEKGHISSSTKLGCIYLSDKKESEGIELIKLAADTKYPEAIYQLAIAYREGLGVQQSFQTSFQMLSQKCLATHEKARVALGLCYWHGTGTIRNEKRAFEIISNCGLQDVHSLHLMATAYHEGIGVPINAYKAVEYYRQAASRSYAPSEYCLGRAYLTGKGAPQHISHARHYLELSSGKNYRPAQTLLATLYITGRGVSKNHDRAFKLFLRSANEGDAIAINQVALCYLKGKGVGVDFDKAREWFEKGAQLGYEPCKKNLKILDLNPVLRC